MRSRTIRGSLAERFWPKVNKLGPKQPHMKTRCWVWTASLNVGYGQIGRGPAGAGAAFAHRVSWELRYGKIPSGRWVLHKCDNPPCIRPSHLYLGAPKDNESDMTKRRRRVSLHGEESPHAKLTEADVRCIRAEYEPGKQGVAHSKSQKSIAKRYGVSAFTISQIIRRVKWAHVR